MAGKKRGEEVGKLLLCLVNFVKYMCRLTHTYGVCYSTLTIWLFLNLLGTRESAVNIFLMLSAQHK